MNNIDELIYKNLDINGTDIAYKNISFSELINSIIKNGALINVAKDLNIQVWELNKILPTLFTKPKKSKWKNYLLEIASYKYCNGCEQILELINFPVCSNALNGINSYCKYCVSISNDIHYKNNKPMYRAKEAKYRANKLASTPKWANLKLIEYIYDCKPYGCHVDHIIPLQGDIVCGLHVETNLQYLTAEENMSKGNRFNPLDFEQIMSQ